MSEEQVLIDAAALALLEERADELILSKNIAQLKSFSSKIDKITFVFDDDYLKSRYLYTLANCYSEIYKYNCEEWYSDDLSKAVINYRKALHVIRKIEYPTNDISYLQSCIETNLGNYLSSQGRIFCCIPFWNDAFQRNQNLVSVISKANNQLFIASKIYDPNHRSYHYFEAYNLIKLGLERVEDLLPDQKIIYSEDGKFMHFISWFEQNFKSENFASLETFEEQTETRKQRDYLKWCGDNRLFINDLNDINTSELVYQDIMTLPTISQEFNMALAMHEELMYHGNFDELKNDYCYARYLFFSSKNIPNEEPHFFNSTYPHVNDLTYSITNLKASHYKSAFKTIYSLFDKIAYFINRFFDLNDMKFDKNINFDSIFRELRPGKWKPHPKLKESKNYFIHALFYILKDIRDVKDSSSISSWLDPDTKAFSEIRNAIEHRSLKIVDDFGYSLIHTNNHQIEIQKLNNEIDNYKVQLQELNNELGTAKKAKDKALKADLEKKEQGLKENLHRVQSKLLEKNKLSSHSLLITVSDFESRLLRLMRLARNAIMYLSLAIHLEEQNKPNHGMPMMSRDVPLK